MFFQRLHQTSLTSNEGHDVMIGKYIVQQKQNVHRKENLDKIRTNCLNRQLADSLSNYAKWYCRYKITNKFVCKSS